MMFKNRCLVVGALLSNAILFSAMGSASAQTTVNCFEVEGASPRSIECPLPVDEPSKVQSSSVLVSNTGVTVPSSIVDRELSTESASWLILIDKSDGRRRAAVKSATDFAKSVSTGAKANERFAVATFAEDYNLVSSFGSTPSQLAEKVDGIKAEGLATELYRSALEAIKALAKEQSEKKALVILSDGKAEDQAFTIDQVIEEAKKVGVVIYGIGIPERASDTPNLQSLRVLAQKTGGPFVRVDATTKEIPKSFVSRFKTALLGGGRMVVFASPEATTAYTIDLTLDDDSVTRITATQSTASKGSSDGGDNSGSSSGSSNQGNDQGILAKVQNTFNEYWNDEVYRWIIVAVGAVLLILLLWLLFGRRRSSTDSFDGGGEGFDFGSSDLKLDTGGFNSPDTSASQAKPSRFVSQPKAEVEVNTAKIAEPATSKVDERGGDIPTQKISTKKPLAVFEIADDGKARKYKMTSASIRIGRHKDNDLILENDTVHRSHAVLHRTPDGELIITDLNTDNGLIVNGEQLDKSSLEVGDEVEFGEAKIKVDSIS